MTKQTSVLPCLAALIFFSVIPCGLLASAFPTEKVWIQKRSSSGCPTDIWSNWTNRDTPMTTWKDREHIEGDNEYFNETEIRAFCPDGNATQVECVTANSSINSSQYIYTCDVHKGLVCENGKNGAQGCVDFQIRYKCTIPCPAQQKTESNSITESTSVMSQNKVQEKMQGETTSPTVWKVHAGVCGALFLAVLLLLGKVFFMAKK